MTRKSLQVRGGKLTVFIQWRNIHIPHKDQPGESSLPKWLTCLWGGKRWRKGRVWKRNSLCKPKNSRKLVIRHLLSLEQSPTERGTLPCSQQETTVQARGTGSFRFSRATTSCRSCSCFRQKRGWDSLLPSLGYNSNFSSASFLSLSLPFFLFATVVFVLFLTGEKRSPQVEVAFRIHRGPGSPLKKAPHHKQGQHFHYVLQDAMLRIQITATCKVFLKNKNTDLPDL